MLKINIKFLIHQDLGLIWKSNSRISYWFFLGLILPKVSSNLTYCVHSTCSYETGDGIKAHEEGTLKKVNDELVETVSGGFEYTAPDGKPISISYVADETGYHPVGDSIPVAPPVPALIAKLIQYLEAHPELHEPSLEHTS